MEPPRNDADMVILGGDIARPTLAVEWTAALDKPVLYVPGNHEFYGDSIDGAMARLRLLLAPMDAGNRCTMQGIKSYQDKK